LKENRDFVGVEKKYIFGAREISTDNSKMN